MPQRQPPAHSSAKRVALCGVLAALSLLFLLMAGVVPLATFTGPFFASLCFIPIVCEFGYKTPLTAYLAVSLLAFLLVGNKEVVLFYILLTGYYPIIQPCFARLSSRIVQAVLKLLLFACATAAVYALLLFVLGSPELLAEFQDFTLGIFVLGVLAGSITFVLYDILVDKVRILYLCRFRKFIFH